MKSRSAAIVILVLFTVGVFTAAAFFPRIPQPLSYHDFADQRAWLGVLNFLNVISNVPFAVVGLMGLLFLAQAKSRARFLDPRERWPYAFVFVGLFLTAFGSGYYHLHPDNARLLWDRLPMTIAFMAIVAALIAERVSIFAGVVALGPMLILGAASAIQWRISELHGAGDLRFYAAVQVYAVLVLPLLLVLFPARYTRSADLVVVFVFYVLAKILEAFDAQIFALGRVVSGHTLKHLAAAFAGYWILRMICLRRPLASGTS